MFYFIQATASDTRTAYDTISTVKFGGVGDPPGSFRSPRGLAIHNLTDMIYVADTYNHRICQFNAYGDVQTCMPGYTTDNGNIVVSFNFPRDVSVSDERLIISDDYRVIVTHMNMALVYVWGDLERGSGVTQFGYLMGVVSHRDPGHQDLIYVADSDNSRLQVLNLANPDDIAVISVIADDPSVSYLPYGIAVDPVSGDIFVSGLSVIIMYNNTGHYIRHFSKSDLGVDKVTLYNMDLYKNQIYVSDGNNRCVHMLSYSGSYVQKLGGPGTCAGCFDEPYGIVVHSATGVLIVGDISRSNMQIFTPLR